MKKLILILLLFPLLVSAQVDYSKYLPKIAWSTILEDVTYVNVDTFMVTVSPLNTQEPGARPLLYGNYLMDNRGFRYEIVDTTIAPVYAVKVVDIFGVGYAPANNKVGYVYESAGNGESHSLPTILFDKLQASAFDYGYRLDMNILWGQLFNPHDSIQFTLQSDLAHQEGKVFYDSIKHALSYYNDVDGVTVNMALEQLIRVYNNSLVTVPNGIVVAPSGDQFGNPGIVLADSRYKETSTLIAVTTHAIPPLTFGWVTKAGEVGGLNTLAYAGFKFLYLNGDGEITTTRPTGGHYETIIGSPGKIDAIDGTIVVDIRTSAITVEQQGYTGWPDADDNSFPDNVGISLDGTTRTLILTATPADEYYHYQDGEKYVFTADTFVYSNTEGVILLSYDKGEIVEDINPTDTKSRQVLERRPGIMNIYNSVPTGDFIYVNNEFHTFDMNGKTKGAFHDIHACTIIEPIGLVDFSVNGNGNLDIHAQFGNLSGAIRNEDIKTVVPSTVSTEGYSIFYKDGVSAWLRATNPGFGVITTGTGRLAYNEDVVGSWQLTEATNGDYVYYLFLVSNTLGLKYGTIPGHNSYADKQDAVDGGLADAATILQNLPIKEIAKVALVVLQTRDNYTNAVKGRIVSVIDPITGEDVDYIDLSIPGIGAGSGGSGANTLLDLTDGFSSYAGRGDDILVNNSAEDGFTSLAELPQSKITGLVDSLSAHDGRINANATNIATLDSEAVKSVNSISPTLGNVDIGLSNLTDYSTTDAITVGGLESTDDVIVADGKSFVLNTIGTGSWVELVGESDGVLGIRPYGVGTASPITFNGASGNVITNGTISSDNIIINNTTPILTLDNGSNEWRYAFTSDNILRLQFDGTSKSTIDNSGNATLSGTLSLTNGSLGDEAMTRDGIEGLFTNVAYTNQTNTFTSKQIILTSSAIVEAASVVNSNASGSGLLIGAGNDDEYIARLTQDDGTTKKFEFMADGEMYAFDLDAATSSNVLYLQPDGEITHGAAGGGLGTVTSVAAGNGMKFTTITNSGSVTMGTPSSITSSSTNSVSSTSHTHALDLSGTFSGAKVTRTSSLTISTTGTVVTFDSENFDTDSYHHPTVNTDRFTISTTGYYRISFNGFVQVATTLGGLDFDLLNSGVTIAQLLEYDSNNTNLQSSVSYSDIHYLTSGDYITVKLSSRNSNSSLFGGTNLSFSIEKL